MSAWHYNLAILKGRWPRVAKAIEAVTIEDCKVVTGTPEQALEYKGHQITSAFDPLDEAKRQAEHIRRGEEAVYCYGIGLGHLPAVLAARHKGVRVVIMNATIARAAMESSEQRWLSAPHVDLVMAEDVEVLFIPFAVVPMECRYADEQGYALRDRVFAIVNQRYVNDHHFGKTTERDNGHATENTKHLTADKPVAALAGLAPGKSAVVIGGGPSLVNEVDWVRSQQENGSIVITVSTSLRFLLASGIKPDYTAIVDTSPRMLGHIEGLADDQLRSTLVYHPTVLPEFIGRWKGPRFYFVDGNDELFISGTVTHTACSIAAKLGCASITLVGCDFCYPNRQSHLPGTMDYEDITYRPTLIETIDGHGTKVYTDYNLAQYHRHLEDYIARRAQHIKWLKRGRSGVPVRGAEWT